MLPIFNNGSDEMTSAASMDISESFRPEDLSKTDFFDFVSAPSEQQQEQESNQVAQSGNNVNSNSSNSNNEQQQALQGFDQFWGAEKETQQQRLETAIFEDLNRYCWNQQSNTANISISTATSNSSNSTSSGPQIINSTDGQIYTITVLNSSSGDQWLRKDITTNGNGGGGGGSSGNNNSSGEQTNGLDINLDTILNNYPYVKTECFSYEDSGFGSKDDIGNFQQAGVTATQILQPQSNVTTTSILLESTLSASSDLINYTDVSNNNNADWSMEQKDWEANEAISNESPESLLRSALQGKGYAKTVHLQTLLPTQNAIKQDEELRRVLFTNDQEALTFADSSTLSNALFDDSQNPQSTLSQATGVVDEIFLTLDNAFSEELNNNNEWNIDRNDIKNWDTCETDLRTNMIRKKQVPRHLSDVNEFNSNDKDMVSPTLHSNGGLANGNGILSDSSKKSWSQAIITGNDGTPRVSMKATKKYKKSINSTNSTCINNGLGPVQSNGSSNSSSSISGTVCNGIRKERSLHYCSICSKGFKDKYSVNVHIRTHTGEKPFQCSLCGKSFRQKAHLAKHYQTHLQKTTNSSVKSKHHQKHSIANSQSSQPIAQNTLNVINVVAGR